MEGVRKQNLYLYTQSIITLNAKGSDMTSRFLCATCDYWSFVRKTYGDARSKTGKVSNLVNGPVPWNEPPPVLTSDGNFGGIVGMTIVTCHSCFTFGECALL